MKKIKKIKDHKNYSKESKEEIILLKAIKIGERNNLISENKMMDYFTKKLNTSKTIFFDPPSEKI